MADLFAEGGGYGLLRSLVMAELAGLFNEVVKGEVSGHGGTSDMCKLSHIGMCGAHCFEQDRRGLWKISRMTGC